MLLTRKKAKSRKRIHEVYRGILDIGNVVLLKKGNGYYVGENFYRATKDMFALVKHALSYSEIYILLEDDTYCRTTESCLELVIKECI